ncbi:MAG: FeoC-like transcriptional regulator [Burkholderiales bacterium]|jgi:predicted ArsR family transcriptional regulator|nr:FeoC-like transcriptional regulator [Burkholderiales bacterium]
MLLIELRDYVKERQEASLAEIASRFKLPESALEAMMQHWVQKGVIEVKTADSPCCRGCKGCKSRCALIYRWFDKK